MNTTRSLLLLSLSFLLGGCATTAHGVAPATDLGVAPPRSTLEGVIDEPGPVTVETVVAADWVVDRSGLIDLDHPKAKAAGLTSGDEPIQIHFHAVRHPTRGLFLVDTGVERAFRDAPSRAVIRGMTSKLAHLEKMTTRTLTGDWIAKQDQPVRGVFLTHLHLDHVLGLRDVPASAPVYAGPGETRSRSLENLFVSGIFDESLEGKGPLREWTFERDPSGAFAGVVDVFGDGTFWAIAVPGHTPGSTAYVARTPSGPVLLTGDACHTAWGWENGVEPGTFSEDRAKSVESLAALEGLARRHPTIDVRLGHQALRRVTPPGSSR
jgi:glyoxylase-like metal-dependent hydrolase (beta-lactamase superfamily II)